MQALHITCALFLYATSHKEPTLLILVMSIKLSIRSIVQSYIDPERLQVGFVLCNNPNTLEKLKDVEMTHKDTLIYIFQELRVQSRFPH